MRLAEGLAALRGWCKPCLRVQCKPHALRLLITGIRGSMVIILRRPCMNRSATPLPPAPLFLLQPPVISSTPPSPSPTADLSVREGHSAVVSTARTKSKSCAVYPSLAATGIWSMSLSGPHPRQRQAHMGHGTWLSRRRFTRKELSADVT